MTMVGGVRINTSGVLFLRSLVPIVVLCLSGFAMAAVFAVSARAADSPFTVAKLAVDVTAKDAVTAKRIGMGKAQQDAFDVVLERLVPLSDAGQLPILEQEDVEGMVSGVSVRREQMSNTRYIASLDVSFNEYAVRQLLESYGVRFSEARSSSISILPLVIEGDAVKSEGGEGWRQAWAGLDLSHSMVPATVLKPRPGLEAATVTAILNGDDGAFVSMQDDYGNAPLVLAVARLEGNTFTTRLVGVDSVGDFNLEHADIIVGGDTKAAARAAAGIAFGILENRWKTMQSGEGLPTEVRHQEAPLEDAPRTPAEVSRIVVAAVEFSGLSHWQDIRGRLMNVRGLQALEVNALSARGASVTFDYAGSLGQLQSELSQLGIVFEDRRDGTFVLRSQ
jgi:hypothetical protein